MCYIFGCLVLILSICVSIIYRFDTFFKHLLQTNNTFFHIIFQQSIYGLETYSEFVTKNHLHM